MRITHSLIEKIHHDLVWWKENQMQNPRSKVEAKAKRAEESDGKEKDLNDEHSVHHAWKSQGLNHASLDHENRINSHWRHVRTRLYFTSASHLYSLLNVIMFGLSIANIADRKIKNKAPLDEGLKIRMDFLSGIYFRVFENLIVEEDDPARFKLEIFINNGAILNPDHVE